MFREWGFLITEIAFLLLLAALLGLLVGWIIWGRRRGGLSIEEGDRLKADLERCRKLHGEKDAQIRDLEVRLGRVDADVDMRSGAGAAAEGAAANRFVSDAEAGVEADEPVGLGAGGEAEGLRAEETIDRSGVEAASVGLGAGAAAAGAAANSGFDSGDRDYDGDGIIEGKDEGVKPETLTAARGGKADDLKQIKGIGPKLEQLCNTLGFYHFDQIASWTGDEVAWVDANLEGFRGRVSRDAWVAQAKILAAGGETEFSQRVEKGKVY